MLKNGKDAAVAYGSVDFKFKNNNDFDIIIYAVNNFDTISVSLAKL